MSSLKERVIAFGELVKVQGRLKREWRRGDVKTALEKRDAACTTAGAGAGIGETGRNRAMRLGNLVSGLPGDP